MPLGQLRAHSLANRRGVIRAQRRHIIHREIDPPRGRNRSHAIHQLTHSRIPIRRRNSRRLRPLRSRQPHVFRILRHACSWNQRDRKKRDDEKYQRGEKQSFGEAAASAAYNCKTRSVTSHHSTAQRSRTDTRSAAVSKSGRAINPPGAEKRCSRRALELFAPAVCRPGLPRRAFRTPHTPRVKAQTRVRR